MIWPFRPKIELTETLAWNTEIMQSRGPYEQRIALREAPVRSFALRHVLTQSEYAAAREIVRQAESYDVPDWMLARASGAAIGGVSVVVSCPLVDEMGLAAGDDVLCWSSAGSYQAATVESVEAGAVTVDSISDFAGGYLVPLMSGLSEKGLSAERRGGRLVTADIEFLITENDYLGATSYPQYLGHDVMTDVPIIGGLSDSDGWDLDIYDNKLGAPEALRQRDFPACSFTLSWLRRSSSEALALRKWLHSRHGRQKAFWASTGNNDFAIVDDIAPADTTITVQIPSGLDGWSRIPIDIEILTLSGDRYYRRITSAVVIDGDLVLGFPDGLGVSLAVDDVRRVSLLRCARLDKDRIELLYRPGVGLSVTVACLEIPES